MKNAPLFERNVPTLVGDRRRSGKIVGRNNSNLNRGAISQGTTRGSRRRWRRNIPGCDVWYENDRYLATYVAVRDDERKMVGAVVIGRPLNDTLSRVGEATTGRPLVLVVPKGDG